MKGAAISMVLLLLAIGCKEKEQPSVAEPYDVEPAPRKPEVHLTMLSPPPSEGYPFGPPSYPANATCASELANRVARERLGVAPFSPNQFERTRTQDGRTAFIAIVPLGLDQLKAEVTFNRAFMLPDVLISIVTGRILPRRKDNKLATIHVPPRRSRTIKSRMGRIKLGSPGGA